MSSAPGEPVDLLDLKLLPAWLKESPDAKTYEHHEGDTGEQRSPRRDGPGGQDRRGSGRDGGSRRPRDREPRRPDARAGRPKGPRPANRPQVAQDGGERRFDDRDKAAEALAARIAVRFLPHPIPFFPWLAFFWKSRSAMMSISRPDRRRRFINLVRTGSFHPISNFWSPTPFDLPKPTFTRSTLRSRSRLREIFRASHAAGPAARC